MLRFKVIDKIQASGHIQPHSFLLKTVGFGPSKATKFNQDKQQNISLADLSSLCKTLNCTPNDLLYWQQDAKNPLPDTHPCLSQLTPPHKESNWAVLANQLTEEEREKVYALMQQHIDAKEAPQPE